MPFPKTIPEGWKLTVETERGPYLEHFATGSIFSPSGVKRLQVLNEEDDFPDDDDECFSPLYKPASRKSPRLAAKNPTFLDPNSDEAWDLAEAMVSGASTTSFVPGGRVEPRPKPSAKKKARKAAKSVRLGREGADLDVATIISKKLGGLALSPSNGKAKGSISVEDAAKQPEATQASAPPPARPPPSKPKWKSHPSRMTAAPYRAPVRATVQASSYAPPGAIPQVLAASSERHPHPPARKKAHSRASLPQVLATHAAAETALVAAGRPPARPARRNTRA